MRDSPRTSVGGMDLYDVLNVPRDADASAVRRAYHKAARKYHPDKNRGHEEEAAFLFKGVVQAYDVLRDPVLRSVYDQRGFDGLEDLEIARAAAAQRRASEHRPTAPPPPPPQTNTGGGHGGGGHGARRSQQAGKARSPPPPPPQGNANATGSTPPHQHQQQQQRHPHGRHQPAPPHQAASSMPGSSPHAKAQTSSQHSSKTSTPKPTAHAPQPAAGPTHPQHGYSSYRRATSEDCVEEVYEMPPAQPASARSPPPAAAASATAAASHASRPAAATSYRRATSENCVEEVYEMPPPPGARAHKPPPPPPPVQHPEQPSPEASPASPTAADSAAASVPTSPTVAAAAAAASTPAAAMPGSPPSASVAGAAATTPATSPTAGNKRKSVRRSKPKPGQSLQTHSSLKLREAVRGGSKTIRIKRLVTCSSCRGSGGLNGEQPTPCDSCAGSGELRHVTSKGTETIACPDCEGVGEGVSELCIECVGAGKTAVKVNLVVDVPVGAHTGMTQVLQGEGDAGDDGGPPGDLHVVFMVEDHPFIKRENGDDCRIFVPISLVESALGGQVRIPALYGTIQVEIPPGTPHDMVQRVPSQGFPHPTSRKKGTLYLQYQIEPPQNLSREQKDLLNRLRESETSENIGPRMQAFRSQLTGMSRQRGKSSERIRPDLREAAGEEAGTRPRHASHSDRHGPGPQATPPREADKLHPGRMNFADLIGKFNNGPHGSSPLSDANTRRRSHGGTPSRQRH